MIQIRLAQKHKIHSMQLQFYHTMTNVVLCAIGKVVTQEEAGPYQWLTFVTASAAGVLGSNLAGLLINYAFSFEESNTKLSIFDNSGIIISYVVDTLIFSLVI